MATFVLRGFYQNHSEWLAELLIKIQKKLENPIDH